MIQILKSHTTDMNIEIKLYVNESEKYCVMLFDLDAEEVITIKICKNLEQAETVYNNFVEWG